MSCGKVHTRRVTARRVVAVKRHAAPVTRRTATPTGKGAVTRAKTTKTPVRRGKTSKRVVVKQFKFTRAGFLAWLKKQQHPAAHKMACQAKLRTAAVVKKKTHSRKLQRPFKVPLKQQPAKAVKGQAAVKSRKPLRLRNSNTFGKVKKGLYCAYRDSAVFSAESS